MQVLIQGGHNPNLKIEYYEEVFKAIKTKRPQIGVHGLSASEIDMIAKIENSSIKEVLSIKSSRTGFCPVQVQKFLMTV
jgi:cyclic dehypoxanthinyl futalosine synthase